MKAIVHRWTGGEGGAILRPMMDRTGVTSRAVLLGHLTITVPVIAFIPSSIYFGLYMFGPFLWPYYASAGLAVGWQLYSTALPHWKEWLTKKGVEREQTEETAQRGGLIWPGAATAGAFSIHTTAAVICGVHLGPWLLSRWFVWILPLLGMSSSTPSADRWLEHFEIVSIVPALVVGYVVCRYLRTQATSAWIVPTVILCYRLLTFTNPHSSVFASDPWSGFSYYFVIERLMPTLYNFRGSDPIRVALQMSVVAPFYSGVAYSLGALTKKHRVLERLVRSFLSVPEAEVFSPEEAGVEWVGDTRKDPAHEGQTLT